MPIVTRILQAETPETLLLICKATGYMRADIWRRLGGVGTIGKSANDIGKGITSSHWYADLHIDGALRQATQQDIIDDILLYRAAAMQKVRQAIYARTTDETERKRLYTLLRKGDWLSDNFLHRQMRKHFKHGKSSVANQFIVRSDKHNEEIINGQLIITIHIAKKYGEDIRLATTSNGKNVDLSHKNLRIIVKNGYTEIHYATNKGPGRPCGDKMIGLDKGYTEAFTDSDGEHHRETFGAVLTEFSNKVFKTGRARNKLHSLEKKHREAGRTKKANNIKTHNLGLVKLTRKRVRAQQHLRTIAFQSAHKIVDKAKGVVSEDLTSPIAKKRPWKGFNRRMSSWAKGALAEALDSVCTQRGADHHLVNAAYTSQMDSVTGLLQGKRVGDRFYRETGDVLQADHNAAVNVLRRYGDAEITRYTPYREVRRILLARSPAQLSVNRHELGLGLQASTVCG